ncbi:Aromatic-ring hydroxylase-like protein [Apiospora saccharicola]
MAKPVLIVGAGIVGLTIAHGLKKIYERDEDTNVRPQGWALTLHWVLPYLERLLDAETFARLETVQVDPEFARHDTGNFLFLNLATEKVKFKIPPNKRHRLDRERFRGLLLEGVRDHVHWSSTVVDVRQEEAAPHHGVSAIMQDGSSVSGALLIGVEGTNSRIRRFLVPDGYENYQLPARMMGVKLEMTEDQVAPLRRLDPLLFQGAHPTTGTFMWFSILDVPDTNGTADTSTPLYHVQLMFSWLLKGPEDEIPESNGDRLKQMRTKADGLSPTFDRVIQNIPATVPVIEVKLVDWVPAPNWDNRGGSVTLAGDAAHAMTMYRGEAANHGILDAYLLVKAITSIHNGEMEQKDAINAYEAELRRRTQPAVLLSREACLGAHDYDALNENSAVVRRRAVSLTD